LGDFPFEPAEDIHVAPFTITASGGWRANGGGTHFRFDPIDFSISLYYHLICQSLQLYEAALQEKVRE
jgi:hypothetical protein